MINIKKRIKARAKEAIQELVEEGFMMEVAKAIIANIDLGFDSEHKVITVKFKKAF